MFSGSMASNQKINENNTTESAKNRNSNITLGKGFPYISIIHIYVTGSELEIPYSSVYTFTNIAAVFLVSYYVKEVDKKETVFLVNRYSYHVTLMSAWWYLLSFLFRYLISFQCFQDEISILLKKDVHMFAINPPQENSDIVPFYS